MAGPAIRTLAIMIMTAFLAAPAVGREGRAGAEPPPLGAWTVVHVERAPWAQGKADPGWRGRTIRFTKTRLSGPGPFACTDVRWTSVAIPPEGLFQGNLPQGRAAAEARRIGLADPAPTLRLDCTSGSFDLHGTARGYVVALDNDLLFLEPAGRKRQ